MRSTCVVLATAVGMLVGLAAPSVSHAAAPPDPNDPCSHAGKDSCGTNGVGFYKVYRYGVRWFGDFRGAVPGGQPAFCLDLRYWYASRGYRYRAVSAAGLRNRDGEAVPLARQAEIAYAISRFGRSRSPAQQAAVMLYVHSRMGDARPGEVDPAALGPKVERLYGWISRATAGLRGPYRVEARFPRPLTVGRRATAALRVLSAAGRPLPYVRLALAATGAGGVPASVRTDNRGTARVALTPTAVAGLRLRVQTAPLASSRPRVLAASTPAARANAQRLALPASRRVTANVTHHDVEAAPQISTTVSSQTAAPGASVTDNVAVTGLGGASAEVQVELWGPFETREAIVCTGKPYWTGSFVARGDSTTTTAPVRLERAGYYTYRESIAARPPVAAVTTPCGETTETTFVQAKPTLTTVVSAQVVRPGSEIFDRIHVEGLGSATATIEAGLYGPFASRAAIRCTKEHLHWQGQVPVNGDSDVATPKVKLARAGFYGFRERLVGSPLVAAVETPCAPAEETALAAPQIVTGRGSVSAFVPARDAGGDAPVRVRVG
jgi:hypothetical protein